MPGLIAAMLASPPSFTWFGGPPQGPSVPFGNATIAIYDTLRVLCMLAVALTTAFGAVLVLRPEGVIGQRIRLLAQIGLAWVALTVEIEHFGDYANMRLILVLIVTAGSAWGNYLGVRYESPPSPHWHGRVSGQS